VSCVHASITEQLTTIRAESGPLHQKESTSVTVEVLVVVVIVVIVVNNNYNNNNNSNNIG
jgi:hypothetical protein